jgi:DNA-binding response OmpR family regulator
MNVMLLEPDRLLAGTYRQALESAGHTVRICASAQAAIFCADEVMPDVVVLELQLIGHSGFEFLYEFRSYNEWQHIPVVVVSNVPAGEFSSSWKLMKEQLGVHAYHYKPLTSLAKLIRTVDRFATVKA